MESAMTLKGCFRRKTFRQPSRQPSPYHNYDKIYAEWWHKVYHGAKDITWPGKPDFFAVSTWHHRQKGTLFR
ncbi:MAG: hypothetical protein U5L09_16920 [Bacteroidales bacterium]|nr:hypothetical protein [Bacteroidales bacterium]